MYIRSSLVFATTSLRGRRADMWTDTLEKRPRTFEIACPYTSTDTTTFQSAPKRLLPLPFMTENNTDTT
jgi:hypothetical protein